MSDGRDQQAEAAMLPAGEETPDVAVDVQREAQDDGAVFHGFWKIDRQNETECRTGSGACGASIREPFRIRHTDAARPPVVV